MDILPLVLVLSTLATHVNIVTRYPSCWYARVVDVRHIYTGSRGGHGARLEYSRAHSADVGTTAIPSSACGGHSDIHITWSTADLNLERCRTIAVRGNRYRPLIPSASDSKSADCYSGK